MSDPMMSFVRTAAERRAREEHARQMAGAVIRAVRYVDLDYFRHEVAAEHEGPRQIVDEAEWARPTWRCDGFDSIDHGVELECADGRVFGVTWQSPSWTEGLVFWEQPLLGNAVRPEADVAVWDVTARSGWADFAGRSVLDVQVHYEPDDDGFWCRRATLRYHRGDVNLLLGESSRSGSELQPSADNVAVVFPSSPLPAWLMVDGT
ncbi:hypothetical protein [Dactylosporangium sp. NPDC000521]|uniref:hypothetical protein n=1 Tax=Dactylosporangium sp. NPDC000521 TaxID=3363975 RepID=UPI0036AF80D4